MHSFIVNAISFFSIVLLFLAAATVSAQPQSPAQPLTPTTTPPPSTPRRGGHHGPNGGNPRFRRRKGHHARGGHHKQKQNITPTMKPAQTQTQTQIQSRNTPITQTQNPNQINSNQLPPSQGNENNANPGKLFGYVPKNDTSCDSRTLLIDEFLHAHNWVRSKYNLPSLTWDAKLESYARTYLMERYNDCKMIHSNSDYGENMFWGQKLHWTPSDAVYYWYDEKNWFDFNTLKCLPNKVCGHFTQVVWRDTEKVGCALQHCNNRSDGMLIACEYDPPGNFDNEHPLVQHN